MSYPKVCLNCETPFEAKRESARFCHDSCRNEWHTENRAATGDMLPQRVERHVLDEVRGLLEEHKGDWALIVREYARRTLLATGYLSAADFTILGVPPEHCNLPGAQIGAFAGAGYMEAISFRRWSAEAKASRKSGKYWVYRITTKGKEQLGPLVGSSSEASGGLDLTARSGESSTEGQWFGESQSPRPWDPAPGGACTSDNSSPGSDVPPDLLRLDEGRRRAPSMFDPYEDWAA